MKNDYVILNIEKEYPGYTGTEKWILATDLSEEEFLTKYPEEAELWMASVVISREMAKVMFRYDFNDRKHLQRSSETEVSTDDMDLEFEDPGAQDEITNIWIREALDALPEDQCRRIRSHYLSGYSIKDIAEEERVNRYTVRKSIKKGLQHLRDYCGVTLSKTEELQDD